MADLIDILGRKLDSSNMTLGEIKGLISSLMKSKVGTARPVGREKEKTSSVNNAISEMKKLFEKYVKDFKKESDEQKKLTQEVVDSIKELNEAKETKEKQSSSQKPDKATFKNQVSMGKAINGLYQAGVVKKHSLATADRASHQMSAEILEAIKSLNANIERLTGKGGGGGGGRNRGGTASGGGEGGDKPKVRLSKGMPTQEELFYARSGAREIQSLVAKMETGLAGFNAVSTVFDGLIDKEREFIQDIRKIAYETEGATKNTKELNRQYENIGDTVAQTGKTRSEFQDEYRKILRSGIKDIQKANSVIKTQLNTEEQLNLKAGELGEEFKNWTIAGKMSVVQIAQMGRNMREVARNTGLSGDAMKAAVNSSSAFIKNLRNAAQFSSISAGNIFELSAIAQKLDVASEIEPLLNAMTSSSNLLLDASDQTRAFLFSAAGSVGKVQQLISGTITQSKEGMKGMAQGINNVLRRFGVESMDAIESLSDTAKVQLNVSLKSQFGLELGQVKKVYEVLNEGAKSYADRLKDLDAKRQQNLTLEEKALLKEEERKLLTDQNLKVLTDLEEVSLKSGKGMQNTFSAFSDSIKKKFGDDLSTMGLTDAEGALKSAPEIIKKTMLDAVNSVNKGLKEAGEEQVKISSKDIERALKSNDPATLRELTKKISSGNQRLIKSQKSQLTPMDEMNENLKELNESLRKITNSGISGLFNSVLGKISALIIAVVGLTSAIGFFGVDLITSFNSIKNTFKRITDSGKSLETVKTKTTKTVTPSPKTSDIKTTKTKGTPKIQGFAAFAQNAEANKNLDDLKKSSNITTKTSKELSGLFAKIKEIPNNFKKGFSIADQAGLLFFGKIDRGFTEVANSFGYAKFRAGLEAVGDAIANFEFKKIKLPAIKDTFNSIRKGLAEIKSQPITAKSLSENYKIADAFVENAAKNARKGVQSAATNFINTIKKNAGETKGIKGYGKGFVKSIGSGIEDLSKGIKTLGRTSLTASGNVFKLAAKMSPLALAFTVVDLMVGTLTAGAKAAEIFDKNLEDLTLNEEYAAKTAGFLRGVIATVTFGLSELLLPMDSFVEAVAKFNAKVPILTIALFPLVVAVEVLWGVLKGVFYGILEVFYGIGDLVMNIVNPALEGLSGIFSALTKIFESSSSATQGLTNTMTAFGGISGIVSSIFIGVGKAIRWVLGFIGSSIGFVIKAILGIIEGFVSAFDWIGPIISEVSEAFGSAFSEIATAFQPVMEFFGIFSEELQRAFGSMSVDGSGFIDLMKNIGWALGKVVSFLVKFVVYPIVGILKGIANFAQGIAKLFQGDIKGFGESIWNGIKEIFSGLGRVMYEIYDMIPSNIVDFVYEGMVSLFIGIGKLLKNLPKILFSTGKLLIKAAIYPFKYVLNYIVNNILKVFDLFSRGINFIFEQVRSVFEMLGKILKGDFSGALEIGGKILQNATSALAGIGSYLWNNITSGLSGIGEWIYEKITGYSKKEEERGKKLEADHMRLLNKRRQEVLDKIASVTDPKEKKYSLIEAIKNAKLEIAGYKETIKIQEKTIKEVGSSWFYTSPEKKQLEEIVAKKDFKISELKNLEQELQKVNKVVSPEEKATAASTEATAKELKNTLGTKGSGYVHDIHCEEKLINACNILSAISDKTSVINNENKIKPKVQTINNSKDIETLIATEKASTSPSKSEVTSKDLGIIASESEEQNEKLDELIKLFSQVVKYMKPESSPVGSSGGATPDTSMNKIGHKTPNFFRNNIGLMAQNPSKAILNLGPQNI